jgi:hypothetical protein
MTVLAGTVALIAGAGAAYAVTEPNNGVITSCYNTNTGAVRMVNAGVTCAASERKLTWASNLKPKVHQVGAVGEPAYQSDWKAYNGPPWGNASFYRDAAGVVHLSGLACSKKFGNPSLCEVGYLIGGTSPIFTLPAGFRPARQLLFTTLSFGDSQYWHARIDITTGGVVELIAPPNGGDDWVSFDGISFLAN